MMLKLFCRFSKLRNGIFYKYEIKNCNFLQIFKKCGKTAKNNLYKVINLMNNTKDKITSFSKKALFHQLIRQLPQFIFLCHKELRKSIYFTIRTVFGQSFFIANASVRVSDLAGAAVLPFRCARRRPLFRLATPKLLQNRCRNFDFQTIRRTL